MLLKPLSGSTPAPGHVSPRPGGGGSWKKKQVKSSIWNQSTGPGCLDACITKARGGEEGRCPPGTQSLAARTQHSLSSARLACTGIKARLSCKKRDRNGRKMRGCVIRVGTNASETLGTSPEEAGVSWAPTGLPGRSYCGFWLPTPPAGSQHSRQGVRFQM